jgi:serine/threonine protein kinase
VRNAKKEEGRIPPNHVAAIISGMLHGLHAAHEAKSERREPLNIVHRDVSPQNVLVGVDGVARVLDFGVAKAALRSQSTRDGQMKGKLSYMSPEQLNGKPVDRRTDLFAAGVVLWEALTGRRLFDGSDAGEIFAKVVAAEIPEPKTIAENIPDTLNAVVMKALERNPDKRYQTAREFAIDLESSIPVSTGRTVGEWVERFAGPDLERRLALVSEIESASTSPEDLAKMVEDEDVTLALELPEQLLSAVQPVSGSRPRITPPLASAVKTPDAEDRSSGSLSLPGNTTSQVSNLTLPQTPPPPARSNTTSLWLGALGACVGGGVLAYFVFGVGNATSQTTVTGSPSPGVSVASPRGASGSNSAAQPFVAPPTETVNIADLPAAPPETDENAVFEQVPNPNPAPNAAPRTGAPGPRRLPRAPAAPAVNCNPPFTIDATGIKRPKPGCL